MSSRVNAPSSTLHKSRAKGKNNPTPGRIRVRNATKGNPTPRKTHSNSARTRRLQHNSDEESQALGINTQPPNKTKVSNKPNKGYNDSFASDGVGIPNINKLGVVDTLSKVSDAKSAANRSSDKGSTVKNPDDLSTEETNGKLLDTVDHTHSDTSRTVSKGPVVNKDAGKNPSGIHDNVGVDKASLESEYKSPNRGSKKRKRSERRKRRKRRKGQHVIIRVASLRRLIKDFGIPIISKSTIDLLQSEAGNFVRDIAATSSIICPGSLRYLNTEDICGAAVHLLGGKYTMHSTIPCSNKRVKNGHAITSSFTESNPEKNKGRKVHSSASNKTNTGAQIDNLPMQDASDNGNDSDSESDSSSESSSESSTSATIDNKESKMKIDDGEESTSKQ